MRLRRRCASERKREEAGPATAVFVYLRKQVSGVFLTSTLPVEVCFRFNYNQ
jgi:hypothetical protein